VLWRGEVLGRRGVAKLVPIPAYVAERILKSWNQESALLERTRHDLHITMEQPPPTSAAGGGGGAAGGGGINHEQMKKMSEADKEMELRANRAKALLAERHVGLKAGQVRIADCAFNMIYIPICLSISIQLCSSHHAHIICSNSTLCIYSYTNSLPLIFQFTKH
jgi:hypothetical protein